MMDQHAMLSAGVGTPPAEAPARVAEVGGLWLSRVPVPRKVIKESPTMGDYGTGPRPPA